MAYPQTAYYIKVAMLPQHDSPPPLAILTVLCPNHLRIHRAMSLAAIRTRHFTSMKVTASTTILARASLHDGTALALASPPSTPVAPSPYVILGPRRAARIRARSRCYLALACSMASTTSAVVPAPPSVHRYLGTPELRQRRLASR